jgi:hypothetical protein
MRSSSIYFRFSVFFNNSKYLIYSLFLRISSINIFPLVFRSTWCILIWFRLWLRSLLRLWLRSLLRLCLRSLLRLCLRSLLRLCLGFMLCCRLFRFGFWFLSSWLCIRVAFCTAIILIIILVCCTRCALRWRS